MKKAKLLWIDLEMTGLVPGKDKILELAAVATGWDLVPIPGAELVRTVKVSRTVMERRMVGEFWEKNAETRDALIRASAEGQSSQEVERELLGFIEKWFGKEVYLAGNSVHQDRKFIDVEWPEVAKRLHYRILDVSAWKVYFENALGKKFMKPENHRALDDINGSIEELKWYLKLMKGGIS